MGRHLESGSLGTGGVGPLAACQIHQADLTHLQHNRGSEHLIHTRYTPVYNWYTPVYAHTLDTHSHLYNTYTPTTTHLHLHVYTHPRHKPHKKTHPTPL